MVDLTAKRDINEFGQDGSLQRLIYTAARVGYGYSWQGVNLLAQSLLERAQRECPDTTYSLLLNALCCATEVLAEQK